LSVPFESIIEYGNAIGLILKHGLDVRFVSDERLIAESTAITSVFALEIPDLAVNHEKVVSIIREMEPTLDEKELKRLQKEADKARRRLGVG
jgi:hypothetical protein